MASVITNRDRDCLACRAISGTGLIGIGAYVAYQAKRNTSVVGRTVILGIALGFSAFGVARICDLPPFKNKF